MTDPIKSLEELQNCLALGLDLWVITILAKYPKQPEGPWCMKQPELSMSVRGLKLGSNVVLHEYLARWGIKDSGNHHTVHTWNNKTMALFTTEEAAKAWKKRTFVA